MEEAEEYRLYDVVVADHEGPYLTFEGREEE